ncbi:MAG: protein kinase [Planctomycetales bacterium]|nr:protein kinase [Planctomycetales bacterium]
MPTESSDEHLTNSSSDDATRFSNADDLDELESEDFDFTESQPSSKSGPVGLLGEYLLLEKIGAGGMGHVYRAEHRTMNRQVALKILSDHISGRNDILEQFYAEIRAVAQLMHPNIVTAFDAGCSGETHFLVMELVNGEVLSRRVRQQGPLTTGEAVSVLEQCSAALSFAHSMGIVHRDIKPSNLMLGDDGKLKILDFGLAMFSKGTPTRPERGVFMGTPEYMSPEQITNPDQVDGRSDLYSLGATLFFLLTGEAMFSGQKMQVATAQLRLKPRDLYMVRPDVDLRLDAVFQRLVAKKPSDRFASADELQSAMHDLNLTSATAKFSAFRKGVTRLMEDNPTSVALSKSTLAKKAQIVAIDLGLHVSTAAYYDKKIGPQIIHQGEGSAQHLRNMLWSSGDTIVIGPEAVERRQSDPEKIFHSPQRWIGAERISWKLAGKLPPPEAVIAAILKKIMSNSAQATDSGNSAIVTVPACYDQLHRRSIRTACQMAGIDLVQLLDKSLAAALCWLDLNSRLLAARSGTAEIDSKILVVHLGGSGLESAIVRAQGNTVTQLGVHGSWKLGSGRWQHLLTEYFAGQLREKTGKSIRDDVAASTRLQRTVELAMDRLTRTPKLEVRFEWEGIAISQVVTQEGLVRIAPVLTKAIGDSIQSACAAALSDVSEIEAVLLTGSMMNMRPIEEIVRRAVPHVQRMTVLEKADLARGAAIQAQYLSSLTSEVELPHAIGCVAYDVAILSSNEGVTRPKILIDRSSALPLAIERTLRPGASGGSDFPPIQIIEGTNLGGANWLKLGKVQPSLLFPQRKKGDALKLKLEVDESGLLRSSLIWPGGNRQVHLPETSDQTLSDEEIGIWRRWLDTALLCSDV